MTFGNVEQNFAVSQTELFKQALKWWESFRPRRMTLEQHLENPTIGCLPCERGLAREVAFILKNEVLE